MPYCGVVRMVARTISMIISYGSGGRSGGGAFLIDSMRATSRARSYGSSSPWGGSCTPGLKTPAITRAYHSPPMARASERPFRPT